MKHGASYKYIDSVFSNFYLDGISSKVDYSQERSEVLEMLFKGYISDYFELYKNRDELLDYKNYLETNRLRMLLEIEKSQVGKKTVSILFRVLLVLFSRKKIKDVLGV
jgi:type I restriction-modification system DNA methylase subunit